MTRHTVTGLITTSGRQFEDWSADYRFFSKKRFDPDSLFGVIRRGITEHLEPGDPFIVAMDDTISRKKGRTIPGTSWRRDPMSPPFHANLVWGRRFIQISAILPAERVDAPGRAIPIDFVHAPTVPRPKKTAPPGELAQYRRERRERSLSEQGVRRIQYLRNQLTADGEADRPLCVSVDGSYTNGTVLKKLPENTILIGRIRRDAHLHPLPSPRQDGALGRRRVYGEEVITPDMLRLDPTREWQTAQVYAAGKVHTMRYKTIAPVLWRAAGPQRQLRLFAIAPLRYRLSRRSRILYRNPAFLICTDPNLDPEQVLRAYISRWDIEVNFRDEKQIIGFDQAQVRTPESAVTAPAFAVVAYAILLLAAARAFGVNGRPGSLPPPKWQARQNKPRASTSDLVNHLRFELWGQVIGTRSFSHFPTPSTSAQTSKKYRPDLASAIFYAQPGS